MQVANDAGSGLPEHDTRVHAAFRHFLSTWGVDSSIVDRHVYSVGATDGQTVHFHETEWTGGETESGEPTKVLVSLMDNIICSTVTELSASEIADAIPELLRAVSVDSIGFTSIAPETFITRDTYTSSVPVADARIIARDNPYVNLNLPDFDTYLSTLTSKRRYKVRTALRECASQELTLVQGCVADNLSLVHKWVEADYEDNLFGKMAWAYAQAVEQIRPNSIKSFSLVRGGQTTVAKLVLILRRINGVYVWGLHGFSSDALQLNVGAQALSLVVQHLIEEGVQGILDTTFGYSVNVGSFSTYKRLVCNETTYVYAICAGITPDHTFGAPAYILSENQWRTPDTALVIDGIGFD